MFFSRPVVAAFAVALSLVASSTRAGDGFKSGLQPGETIDGLFEPINVTGPAAGQPHCLVCENGLNPVVMIFAREPSPALVKLLGKVDAATAANRNDEMGSFVVFLNDADDLEPRLQKVAEQQKLQQLVLAIDAPQGPDGFKVAKEADVTVVLYREHAVKANHAFKPGELTEAAIEKILADVPKILNANSN